MMGQMTREDAIREARKPNRWQETWGWAWRGSIVARLLGRGCHVGQRCYDMTYGITVYTIKGSGRTWEAAFADATRRGAGREKGER